MMSTEEAIPKYREACQRIMAYIQSNNLAHGSRLPSEREFCVLWGFSQPTINKAITSLLAEGQLRREGRKLFTSAPAPVETAMQPIHILCPHAEYQRNTLVRRDMVEAAHDVAASMNTNAIPLLARNPAEQRQQLIQLLRTSTPGFVIWPLPYTDFEDLYEQFSQRNVPFVVCDVCIGMYDFVGIDNEYGGVLAVEHLLSLGHRQIAYVTDNNLSFPSLKRRCQGYQYACFTLGLPQSMRHVIDVAGISPESAKSAVARLLSDFPDVTAVYCSNDLLALHMMEAMKERGIRIPGDISIIGFDGIDASQISQPALTTISQDFYQSGVVAVERLFSRIRQAHHVPLSQRWRMRIEPSLIVRESTAAPRPKA